MNSPQHTLIASFVKNVEATLKRDAQFFVSYTRSQMDPVKLRSLKVVEVKRPQKGDDSVSIIVDGTFEGRDGPHKVTITEEQLASCGLSSLTLGMGAAPNGRGEVLKGMRISLCLDAFKGPIADEVKAMFAPQKPARPVNAKTPFFETKYYRDLAAQIEEIDKERSRLAVARSAKISKLNSLCVKHGAAYAA